MRRLRDPIASLIISAIHKSKSLCPFRQTSERLAIDNHILAMMKPLRNLGKDWRTFFMASERVRERRLVMLFWALGLLLGAFQAWTGRNAMNEDGIAYL